MNKTRMILFASIFFILCMHLTMAYNTNDIKAYYSFEESNVSRIIDSQGNYNSSLTSETCKVANANIKGNGLSAGNCATPYPHGYNITIPSLYHSDFSINFWLNSTNTNLETFIGLQNQSNNFWLQTRYQASTNFSLSNFSGSPSYALIRYNVTSAYLSGSHMYSIVYDYSAHSIELYVDGQIYGTSNINDAPPNTTILTIGQPYTAFVGESIDEMSIFNTTLTFFDIQQLYNLGSGLNYSETISNNASASGLSPICVDKNTLCNNPIYFDGYYYCNSLETSYTYCSVGCTNYVLDNTTQEVFASPFNTCETSFANTTTKSISCNDLSTQFNSNLALFVISPLAYAYNLYRNCALHESTKATIPSALCTDNTITDLIYNNPTHTFITSGVCDNGLCTNDCNILGYQECDSSTSFKICTNNAVDSCLHYQTGFGCNVGSYCQNGYCQVLNQSKTITSNPSFAVVPYQQSTNGTSYQYDQNTKTLSVITSQYQLNEGFAIMTLPQASYSGITCNYIENLTYSDQNTYNLLNTTQTYNLPTTNTPSFINISFMIYSNDSTNYSMALINLKSILGAYYENISFYRNSTEKSLKMYINDTLYFTDYSVNSYDDLTDINLIIKLESSTKTFTLSVIPTRQQTTTYHTSVNLFVPSFTDISYVIINTTIGSVNISKFNLVSYAQPSGFKPSIYGDYNKLTCTYSKIGCTKARIYLNLNGLPDFTNYNDVTVCINKLGASSMEIPSATTPMSNGYKMFIFLMILLVVFIMFWMAGYVFESQKLFLIIGVILDIFLLFLASIPASVMDIPLISGLIPLWITIMLGLIAIILGIFIVIRPSGQRE